MSPNSSIVRQNYIAIVFAAILCFLIRLAWFGYFSHQTILTGADFRVQYCVAIIALTLIGAVVSHFVQITGELTPIRGIRIALAFWATIVLGTLTTENTFDMGMPRTWLTQIGFWLVAMVIIGAIVGGWKKRSKA